MAFETLSSSLVGLSGLSKRVVGFKVRAGFDVAGTSSASTQRQNNSGAILVSGNGPLLATCTTKRGGQRVVGGGRGTSGASVVPSIDSSERGLRRARARARDSREWPSQSKEQEKDGRMV